MKLSYLLSCVGIACRQQDVEVTGVTDTLSAVKANGIFVCIRGARFDGHSFASQALRRGAAAVIAETPVTEERTYCVPDSRLMFSLLAAVFYGMPHKRLRTVGITGTNGKTTTAFYLRSILEAAGERCALLGTPGISCNGETAETGYTTPKSDVFFSALKGAADLGCGYAVAEVSSQALAQKRTDGAAFYLGILTNIGRDHLDYHGTTAALAAAKARLCTLSKTMLLNADDRYFPLFYSAAQEAGANVSVYSCRSAASGETVRARCFSATEVRTDPAGADVTFIHDGQSYPARIHTPGIFSVYNALAAFSAAVLCGVSPAFAAEAVCRLPQVPGRAQLLFLHGVRVCVDFAHTPDALLAILQALGTNGKKPLAVFGCGGDRDRGKRAMMGKVAAEHASVVILTSDNPRHEDPAEIIAQIMEGIPVGTRVYKEADRRRAIRFALTLASAGDTVLIAGKGQENYQIIGDEKLPFSDMEAVLSDNTNETNDE